jgi:uncharacterized phiE125 gp8 family phage protein
MNLKLITPPTNEPLSLEEVKLYLRVDGAEEDTLIQSLITVAREQCESITRRALVTQTYELTLDDFPSENVISIPLPPLQSVASIMYKDDKGIETTLNPSNYIVDIDSEPGKIVLIDRPSFTPYPSSAVKITFTCGYSSNIPVSVVQAMKLLVSHFYENRDIVINQSVNQVPFTVDALLSPYRIFRWL